MGVQTPQPSELVIKFGTGLGVSIGRVDRGDKHAVDGRLQIPALPMGGVAWQVHAGHNRGPSRKYRHAVPAPLAAPNRVITGLPDCLRRELGVCGFELLKAHDVGLGFAEPVQKVAQAMIDVVNVETGDLHVQLQTRGIGWRSASHRNRDRSRFGCGHTTDRVPFHRTTRLRSHAGPTIRKSPSFFHDTAFYCSSLLGREIGSHPPRPRTHQGGGPLRFAK
jgi:hypothetical protein